MTPKLRIEWMPGRYAVCRRGPDADVPGWALASEPLACVTRTDRELSIVARDEAVPAAETAERGWVALRVAGTLDFSTVGVLARLSGALAEAGVSLLALSTHDTDILLVRESDAERAAAALAAVSEVAPREAG